MSIGRISAMTKSFVCSMCLPLSRGGRGKILILLRSYPSISLCVKIQPRGASARDAYKLCQHHSCNQTLNPCGLGKYTFIEQAVVFSNETLLEAYNCCAQVWGRLLQISGPAVTPSGEKQLSCKGSPREALYRLRNL